MTYSEYIARCRRGSWKELAREGQYAFNMLYTYRPDLGNQILKTDLDPYYSDKRLPEFYTWVEKNW